MALSRVGKSRRTRWGAREGGKRAKGGRNLGKKELWLSVKPRAEDTDTGESIGSSRRGYLLQKIEKEIENVERCCWRGVIWALGA